MEAIDYIKELYFDRGLSARDTAKQLGYTHTFVLNEIKRNGLNSRNKKEAAIKQHRINICVICGSSFRPLKNRNRATCSDACRTEYLHNINIKPSGHSQAYYQRVRREIKKDVCECCGATPPTRLDTHHKDRDHKNNNKDNLLVLCAHCHSFLHYIEDARGLRGQTDAKRQELIDRQRYDSTAL